MKIQSVSRGTSSAMIALLLLYGVGPAWGSTLVVESKEGKPVTFSFKANCLVNGKIRQGQTCRIRWQVPNGWEFTVNRQITTNNAICLNSPDFGISYNRSPGTVLSAGMGLNYTATMKREILWTNSGLCQVGYEVTARIVDQAVARNAAMTITPIMSADFNAGFNSAEAIWNNWGPFTYKNSYNMSPVASASGGIPSVSLDITDRVDLNPSTNIVSKTLFRVTNIKNNASGYITIAKGGDTAPYIRLYRNGATTPGCEGNYTKVGDYCDVRTLPNIDWFDAPKTGFINVTLTVN
ncbi:UNVERIFIED_ORG: hypothetical protein FHU00_5032 [Citrobacter freundii]